MPSINAMARLIARGPHARCSSGSRRAPRPRSRPPRGPRRRSRQGRIVEGEPGHVPVDDEALDRHLAVDCGHDDAVVAGLEAAGDDGEIAVKVPAPRIEVPEMFQAKVAGGFGASQRGRSRAPSRKSSAGEGKPAQALAEDGDPDVIPLAIAATARGMDAHPAPRIRTYEEQTGWKLLVQCGVRAADRACARLWTAARKIRRRRVL